MKLQKKIDIEDSLAQLFLICLGLYIAITGGFLFIATIGVTGSTYALMGTFMSIDAWSIVFLISGILLIVSSFQRKASKYWSMAFGGLLGGILMSLYAMASFEATGTAIAGVRYTIIACFMVCIGLLGVRELWQTHRMKNL